MRGIFRKWMQMKGKLGEMKRHMKNERHMTRKWMQNEKWREISENECHMKKTWKKCKKQTYEKKWREIKGKCTYHKGNDKIFKKIKEGNRGMQNDAKIPSHAFCFFSIPFNCFSFSSLHKELRRCSTGTIHVPFCNLPDVGGNIDMHGKEGGVTSLPNVVLIFHYGTGTRL